MLSISLLLSLIVWSCLTLDSITTAAQNAVKTTQNLFSNKEVFKDILYSDLPAKYKYKDLAKENITIKITNDRVLRKFIHDYVGIVGLEVDLNFIDVSELTSLRKVFINKPDDKDRFYNQTQNAGYFNGDISRWDTKNVTILEATFAFNEEFQGDISKWDVSNVTNMQGTFMASSFNGDISRWDVSNVLSMGGIFLSSHFNGDISHWNVKKVRIFEFAFNYSYFSKDLSNWDISNATIFTCALPERYFLSSTYKSWVSKNINAINAVMT
ncbi:BspA family leucine-rich repeat surface protein, partial [Psittacicella hinzii]